MENPQNDDDPYRGQGKPKPLLNVRTFDPDPRYTRKKKKEVYTPPELSVTQQHDRKIRLLMGSLHLSTLAGVLDPLPFQSAITNPYPLPKVVPLGKPVLDTRRIRQLVMERMASYEALYLTQKIYGRGPDEPALARLHGNVYATMDAILSIFFRQFGSKHIRATRDGWSIKLTYSYIARQRQLGNCLLDENKAEEKQEIERAYQRGVRTIMNHMKRLVPVGIFTKHRSVGFLSDERPNSICLELVFTEKYVKFKDERHNLACMMKDDPVKKEIVNELPRMPKKPGKTQEPISIGNMLGIMFGRTPGD